jgi:hypothetical protein
MSKQTAVEWYIEENEKMLVLFYDGLITGNDLSDKKQELLTQAKQMEREQHSDTWIDSRVEDKENDYIGKQKSFDEYFTETYGKEELLP